jgi:hypothetical protein
VPVPKGVHTRYRILRQADSSLNRVPDIGWFQATRRTGAAARAATWRATTIEIALVTG